MSLSRRPSHDTGTVPSWRLTTLFGHTRTTWRHLRTPFQICFPVCAAVERISRAGTHPCLQRQTSLLERQLKRWRLLLMHPPRPFVRCLAFRHRRCEAWRGSGALWLRVAGFWSILIGPEAGFWSTHPNILPLLPCGCEQALSRLRLPVHTFAEDNWCAPYPRLNDAHLRAPPFACVASQTPGYRRRHGVANGALQAIGAPAACGYFDRAGGRLKMPCTLGRYVLCTTTHAVGG